MKKNQYNFKKMLHNAKLKSTDSRLIILKTLSEIKHPETVQEIRKKIKKNKVDLVTLYRTLASFEKSQLVRKIDLHKDAVYYELNIDHHHHIVCTKCNKMEPFENSEIEKALMQIASRSSGFKNVKKHSLELFGTCNACAKA